MQRNDNQLDWKEEELFGCGKYTIYEVLDYLSNRIKENEIKEKMKKHLEDCIMCSEELKLLEEIEKISKEILYEETGKIKVLQFFYDLSEKLLKVVKGEEIKVAEINFRGKERVCRYTYETENFFLEIIQNPEKDEVELKVVPKTLYPINIEIRKEGKVKRYIKNLREERQLSIPLEQGEFEFVVNNINIKVEVG